jgi:glycosyltransferase involved in cell wall biosynthesis
MQPLVSIGMSIFNCERTISAAIRSILNQTYENWELLIVDDGSEDKTLEIAKSFCDSRIKIIADGLHQNLPIRLNQVIAISKGKYFARMDGDDISYPERLQIQVQYLETHPEIDLIATQTIVVDRNGNAQGSSVPKQLHAEICSRPWAGFPMTHPTWMGKIEWFRKYQYRTNAIRMEDQEILLRTYKISQFACIPRILLGYRVESLSMKKILIGRYNFSLILVKRALIEADYFLIWGVLEQGIKALIDIFAIATGLNFKILKHRLGSPINQDTLSEWNQVLYNCISQDFTVNS